MARLVNISDVCNEIFAGGDAPKNNMFVEKTDKFSIPIYSNGEAKNGLYGYTNFARVTNPSVTISARGTIGFAAIRNEPFVPIVRLITLTPNLALIDIRYLYYAIQNYHFDGSGTSIPQLTVPMLKQYSFPLPEMEKQIYISTVLDKVNSLISLRKQQLAKLDELVKARFVEMFGDLKHNSMNWPVYSFNDFARIDTTMIHDFEGYGDYPHIGIDSIEKDSGNLYGYRTVKEDGVISGKYLFTPEHIIYSKIRPNLNKVALPNFTGVCSADAYPILPKREVCNRIFLAYTLRSPVFLDYILTFSNRTNLPKVNKRQVEGFCCPIPEIRLQKQFTSFF